MLKPEDIQAMSDAELVAARNKAQRGYDEAYEVWGSMQEHLRDLRMAGDEVRKRFAERAGVPEPPEAST